jgi:hypothetical protein
MFCVLLGYLTQSETSLLIRSVVCGVYKADPSIGLPSNVGKSIYFALSLHSSTVLSSISFVSFL